MGFGKYVLAGWLLANYCRVAVHGPSARPSITMRPCGGIAINPTGKMRGTAWSSPHVPGN